MSLSKHVDADELIERAAASDHLSLVQRAKGARKVSNCVLLPGFNKRFPMLTQVLLSFTVFLSISTSLLLMPVVMLLIQFQR